MHNQARGKSPIKSWHKEIIDDFIPQKRETAYKILARFARQITELPNIWLSRMGLCLYFLPRLYRISGATPPHKYFGGSTPTYGIEMK